MAAKTTVYIPDELFDRAKAHDDLNLSGMLQEALKEEIDRRDLAAADEHVAALVKRIAEQESVDSRSSFPEQYEAGRVLAATKLPVKTLEELEAHVEGILQSADSKLSKISWHALEHGTRSVLGDPARVVHKGVAPEWLDLALGVNQGALEGTSGDKAKILAFLQGIVDTWREAKTRL